MIWIALVAILVPVSCLGYTVYRIQKPTKGPVIDRASRPKKALLVIDMQFGFLDGNGYDPDAVKTVVDAVMCQIKTAKSQRTVVIAVQQEWHGPLTQMLIRLTTGGRGLPENAGTAILPEIAKAADQIIIKHLQDGFERQTLNDLMAKLQIGEIEIIGLDGLYCVRAAALGAINRGYKAAIHPHLVLNSNAGKWDQIMASLEQSGISLIGERPVLKPAST